MIQIHDHGKIIEVEPSDKSQLTRGIMRSSELLLSFRSDVALDIHVGATVDFEGETFTLIYPSELRKLRRGYYDYTVTMHSSAELLKQRLLKDPSDPGRTAFTFTGSAHDFATLVARSMGKGWSVGDCMVSDGDRMIAFREETCLGALARIAEDFHSEWVVERQTIAIRKQELWRDAPVAMSYGKGKGFLSGVSRAGDGDKLPISRLYVVGGSRNIDPAAYGSRSLHLPDGSTSLSSGVEGREAALDLSHIYPSRVGTVSEVVTVSEEKCFYDIKDASIPADLNYSDCRIPGEKAVIRFQSGALAGRELEIRQSETALEGYHHEERRFELVPREEDGFTFPSARWMPKAGDRYAVFGISLPPTYVKEAEERMLREAKRYLEDNKEPVYTFRGEVDGIWARKHWLEVGGKLVPGGHVLFSDPEFHPSGSVIRIVSTTQAVNDPHAPSVTLSTTPVPGSLLSRLDRVEADEVVRREQIREVQRQQSQSYRQALEHLSMVDRAVEGLEGFTRRIKPSVIETMGILVGSQATQLDFVRAIGSLESVTPAINYDPDDKALHVGESVLRHQTIGITTMRDRRDPSEYRYWRLPEYVSPPLTDPDRSYYIYARAARVGTEGSFLLSEEPIPMEGDPDYFHLLIGTLSSLDGGDRAYNRLYGFSMISPGQMVVDTISSANGRMSIDLARGEIYASSVSFSRPDGARGSLSDLAGEVDELQSHPPKIVDGKWHVWDGKAQTYVNTGDDAQGETGKNGLSPKIVDGKWSVWDGSRWVSTGVPAQGPKGEQGAPGKDVDPKVLNDLKAAVDDARRKLDDTVTKAELDGVVSAQEEHDIQAAKAALDAAKKAYDDAVKRAKELDSEIQVGGRNLLLDTSKERRQKGGYSAYKFSEPVTEPGKYILSFDVEVITPPKRGSYLVIFGYQTMLQKNAYATYVEGATHYEVPIDVKRFTKEGWASEVVEVFLYPNSGYVSPTAPDSGETIFSHVKLERGTVSTDWTPAPEDVQAEIAAAKEQAERAQTSTDKLRGYVDGAYKDGIITEVESKAIATYINEVEAMWSSAFGAFERVYVNPLLTGTPKTALSDAKITLAGAKDSLISQIKSAITDGKATAAEATETERLYNVYKSALRDFQKALKSAEESIRDAGKTTGGRNLAVGAATKKRISKGIVFINLSEPLQKGTYYTLSFDVEVYTPPADRRFLVYLGYRTHLFTSALVPYTDGATRYSVTLRTPDKDGEDGAALRTAYLYPHGWRDGNETVSDVAFSRIKLERGIVATDWTPAPEDVQAEIDKVERGYQKLIEMVDVEFAVSSSRTTAPHSGWQTDAPTTTKGQVLWQRTKVYLKDGTTEIRGTTCIQGRDGTDGGKGADGRGISDVKEFYYLSTSNTELKGGVWSETAPTPKEGCWIWTMTRIYYTTGTPTSTKPVCVTGDKGEKGEQGAPGKEGRPGADGHAFTATLRVEGEVVDGQLFLYHLRPSFFYDGREVTGEIGDNFLGRYNLNEAPDHLQWDDWEPSYNNGECDLTDTYTGPGVSFEVKATYRGLTAIAAAFVPHVISPKKLREIEKGLSSADTLVSTVETIKENYMDRDYWSSIIYGTHDALEPLINALKSPEGTQVAGGLLLSKFIALSNQLDKITSYISGMDGGGRAMLAAGVEHFGTPEEDAVSRINYDGTVKFCEIYGNKSYVDFGKPAVLRVGKDVIRDSIEEVFRHNVVEKSTTLSLSVENPAYLDEKSIYIDHDKSSVTFEGQVECGQIGSHLSDRLEIVLTSRDGFDIASQVIPAFLDNVKLTYQLSSTVFLDKGYHTIGLLVRTEIPKYKASISSLKVTQRWSSDLRQAAISQYGVRFWGGPGNYFDYNRSASGSVPAFTLGGGVVINGGLRTDRLIADRIISDGFFACGNVEKYGKLQWYRGQRVSTSRIRDGKYRITHNIGHTNYVITGAIVGNERRFLRIEDKGVSSVIISLHAGSSEGYETTFPSAFDFTIDAGVH